MTVDADDPIYEYGQPILPALSIACRENVTNIWVWAGVFVTTNDAYVTYRIDRQPAKSRRFQTSTNYEAFGLWRGGNAIPFITGLFGKDRILFEFTPHGENAEIAEFRIAGLETAIKPLRRACHW